MDINEIKKLIKEDKAKIIVTGDQGPTLVIMDYAEYKALKENRVTREPILPQRQREEIKAERVENTLEDEGLKIDDLPF
ncbi:MAG: hypothetical protein WC470_03050 [Candidatus Paceibacterota bacterium]